MGSSLERVEGYVLYGKHNTVMVVVTSLPGEGLLEERRFQQPQIAPTTGVHGRRRGDDCQTRADERKPAP